MHNITPNYCNLKSLIIKYVYFKNYLIASIKKSVTRKNEVSNILKK